MREMTVALAQTAPVLNYNEENLRRMAAMIQRICSERPTDLVVFPELAVSGYECGLHFTRLAERNEGHAVACLAEKAAEMNVHVAFGMPVKEKVESILYNGIVLIGRDGELIGDYRKLHLRGEERLAFRAGYRMPVFETEFGLIGLMIGWDLAFPEVARSMTLDGAEMIVCSAAWEAGQMDEWRTFVAARACENAVFLVAANRVGDEPSYSFGGGSTLVGPRGQICTTLDEAVEGYAVATLDLDDVRRVREEVQLVQCRQPAAYRALVRKYKRGIITLPIDYWDTGTAENRDACNRNGRAR